MSLRLLSEVVERPLDLRRLNRQNGWMVKE